MHTAKKKNNIIDETIFKKKLKNETKLLHNWFKDNYFQTDGRKIGAEVEFFILDADYQLVPHNKLFTQILNEPKVIPEAGASQLEINTSVLPINEHFLADLQQNLLKIWKKSSALAAANNYHLALIGSIPHGKKHHSERSYITEEKHYYLMNDNTFAYRNGSPLSIELCGEKERLFLQPSSLSIEGLISSFQLHLEIEPQQSALYYNIIQMISGPLLALSANAPYFYEKNLWSESRIPIFEQLYTFPAPYQNCVFFEPHYLTEDFFPLFQSNLEDYPYLLPEVADNEPYYHMFHVRRQNGSIFRWNRPIIDFNSKDEPYLRIEHRPLSSGPTIVDMVANAAFFYGLIYYFLDQAQKSNPLITLREAYSNFYRAAMKGLDAKFSWNNHECTAIDLLKYLLPLAIKGLTILGTRSEDIQHYLGVIEHRLEVKQNGSIWQQKFIDQYGKNFVAMLAQYLQYQNTEVPVSQWKI